jgi:hypothetical protein
MTTWEYLIVALPRFEAPTSLPEHSLAVRALNDEGAVGWEAVGMSVLADGSVAVLFKRPLDALEHADAPGEPSEQMDIGPSQPEALDT